MADSYTGNINLRKPEVGAATDTWGGVAGLNGDLDILDAIFLATGLSTVAPPPGNPLAGVPGVGLRIGKGMVLNVEGQAQFKNATDVTKVGLFDTSLISPATTRTLQFPNENGVIATQVDVAIRCPTGTVLQGYYGGTAPPPSSWPTVGRSATRPRPPPTAPTPTRSTCSPCSGTSPPTPSARCQVVEGRAPLADYAAHKTLALPNHSGRTMAGRDDLSGAAAGVWPGATVRAAAGGVATAGFHLPAIGVNVGQWFAGGSFGGSTSGSQSVNIVSGGESHGSGGVAFGGSGYFADSHTHNINGNTGGEGLGLASFGASGGTSAYDGSVSVIQPTIVVDVIIAL